MHFHHLIKLEKYISDQYLITKNLNDNMVFIIWIQRIGLELQILIKYRELLQVDDVDIFNRFILKFKSSSTMRLHFTQIYLQSTCLSIPV